MQKQKHYKLAVFIGRLQPFHKGHIQAVNVAAKLADKVLILIGSSNTPRTPKNPWTFEERAIMVRSAFPNEDTVLIKPLNDYQYDEARWIEQVQSSVKECGVGDESIILVGHAKDSSSYYLTTFKQWDFQDNGFFPLEFGRTIDGTKIRELFFENERPYMTSVLTEGVMDILQDCEQKLSFEHLTQEYNYIKEYKKAWATSPYPPIFSTTDAVVIQSGHVLLVRRKTAPGKGLWALPGGFVNPNQTLFDSCLRELREETGLKVPEIILAKANEGYKYFDDPDRSLRGRTITHAFFFKLDDQQDLPRVRGSDDAEKAKWFPLADIESMATVMFEDHWHIIDYFKNQVTKSRYQVVSRKPTKQC